MSIPDIGCQFKNKVNDDVVINSVHTSRLPNNYCQLMTTETHNLKVLIEQYGQSSRNYLHQQINRISVSNVRFTMVLSQNCQKYILRRLKCLIFIALDEQLKNDRALNYQ